MPVWTYFLFLGTALYVFVKVVPATGLEGLAADAVFPRFILTQLPAGLAGLVLTGLLASAMSTLDSSINATAATVTNDFYRVSETLDDLSRMFLSILGGGLVSLFLLGIVTLRVDSRAAITATATTVFSVSGWLFLDTPAGRELFPSLSPAMPDNFWVSTFANLLLFGVAYFVSLLIGSRHGKDLTGLSIWRPGSKS